MCLESSTGPSCSAWMIQPTVQRGFRAHLVCSLAPLTISLQCLCKYFVHWELTISQGSLPLVGQGVLLKMFLFWAENQWTTFNLLELYRIWLLFQHTWAYWKNPHHGSQLWEKSSWNKNVFGSPLLPIICFHTLALISIQAL